MSTGFPDVDGNVENISILADVDGNVENISIYHGEKAPKTQIHRLKKRRIVC